jgi:hypothetical protein
MIIDGPLDSAPERFDERLANCLYMPQADLLILGTACKRPLLLDEAVELSNAANTDALIVRWSAEAARCTFDVKKVGADGVFCALRLWMPRPGGQPWLIPTAGEAWALSLSPMGAEVSHRPPFVDDAERRSGLVQGSRYLSVALNGWF